MTKPKTKRQAWWIFYNEAINPNRFWEDPETKAGLLLYECPKCHARQTRETYLSISPDSFLINFYTLIQDYAIVGIAQCRNCSQWLKIYS